jgi:cell division protein FtsB
VARDGRQLKRQWLQACEAFLSVTLAHTRYLRARGHLADPESAKDIAALEEEHERMRARLERLRAELAQDGSGLRLPQDPGQRLALATMRELRFYRDAVFEDARRLRAHSAALVRRAREARRLHLLDGSGRRTG